MNTENNGRFAVGRDLHNPIKSLTFAARIQRIMYMPTIDTYRFNSGAEPSDEILDALMREVAKEAKDQYATAHTAFFERIYMMSH